MPHVFNDRAATEEVTKAIIEKLKAISRENGKVLFEGRWVARDEAFGLYHRIRIKDRWIFLEILGLFILGILGSFFFGMLLSVVCY